MTKLIINHWKPNNSNINRCYISDEKSNKLGYIQYMSNEESYLVCDDYWRTANIKVEGDPILNKIIDIAKKEGYNIGAFLIQYARNAIVIGNKEQAKAQKNILLTI